MLIKFKFGLSRTGDTTHWSRWQGKYTVVSSDFSHDWRRVGTGASRIENLVAVFAISGINVKFGMAKGLLLHAKSGPA